MRCFWSSWGHPAEQGKEFHSQCYWRGVPSPGEVLREATTPRPNPQGNGLSSGPASLWLVVLGAAALGCAGTQERSEGVQDPRQEIVRLRSANQELEETVVLLEEERADLLAELSARTDAEDPECTQAVADTASPEGPSSSSAQASGAADAGSKAHHSGKAAALETTALDSKKEPQEAKSAPILLSGTAEAKRFDQGRKALARRDFYRAERLFSQFLEAHPRHPFADDALYYRGRCRMLSGRLSLAVRDFREVIERFPEEIETPNARLGLGETLLEQGETEAARAAFRQLLRHHPESVAASRVPREHLP